MRKHGLYEKIGRLFPRRARKSVKEAMLYADVKIGEDAWLGFIAVFSTLLLAASFMTILVLTRDAVVSVVVSVIVTGLFVVLPHLLISLKGDRRADFVEKILPDALLQ